MRSSPYILLCVLLCVQCGSCIPDSGTSRPQILLVTLDTTRFDRLGFINKDFIELTPHLNELAQQACVYRRAYSTVPTTLASHTSMLSGTYPHQHGVHENGRYLSADLPLLGESLPDYRSAAFVSAYPLQGEFGLKRGFDHYDQPLSQEQTANVTADKVIAYLQNVDPSRPHLIWVHFFDAHHPYKQHAEFPNLGGYESEIAFVDKHLGRVLTAFRARFDDQSKAIVVVPDHGEGLGKGGEQTHGSLLTEATIRTPCLVWSSWGQGQVVDEALSTRRVFDIVLSLSKGQFEARGFCEDWVFSEALQPYFQFGWAPLVSAQNSSQKWISSSDFRGWQTLALSEASIPERDEINEEARSLLANYPVGQQEDSSIALDDAARENLASLGYTSFATGSSVDDEERPHPYDQVHLLPLLDEASDRFANHAYDEAAIKFEELKLKDPNNPSVALRLAVCYSFLDRVQEADQEFQRSARLVSNDSDLKLYYGLHCARFKRWAETIELLQPFADTQPPQNLALQALAQAFEATGRLEDAKRALGRLGRMSDNTSLVLKWALLSVQVKDYTSACEAFARASSMLGSDFKHQMDYGDALLALERFDEAGRIFETMDPNHPLYWVACYRRAQVAVITGNADVDMWFDRARSGASPQLLKAINNDPLFRDKVR